MACLTHDIGQHAGSNRTAKVRNQVVQIHCSVLLNPLTHKEIADVQSQFWLRRLSVRDVLRLINVLYKLYKLGQSFKELITELLELLG